MTNLVDAYLRLRRATGWQMRVQEYILRGFVAFAKARGETHIKALSAIEWAARAPSEGQRANRLGMLRVFARFARAEDPGHEVPPHGVFAAPKVRYAPFIFSESHVKELVRRAWQLPPPGSLRPWTYSTLFSLLAATGLRISEALNLRYDDVTSDGLVIRETKFRKSRLVPLHPSVATGLERYLKRRQPTAHNEHVFVTLRGTAIRYQTVITTFLRLVRAMGIHAEAGHGGARIHDLRHSFAVRALELCPASRPAIDAHMMALSTYMGHANVESTYWYLHATPRLLAEVADATEKFVKGE
ncbi:MAG: tyrosine-type recombinase/integrase [Elusimicrobia bacterium]|nr:tyrosine-type recombinase/integrase [Elusimicrobiota bacterium]